MLDKDIVRRRLDTGITYTEFSYMILQALDFKHLHEEKRCRLAMCWLRSMGKYYSTE